MVGEVLVDFFRWNWFGCACCRGCRCGEGGCGYHDHNQLWLSEDEGVWSVSVRVWMCV